MERPRGRRYGPWVFALVALALAGVGALLSEYVAAWGIIEAPNFESPPRPSPRAKMRVEVGPPPATIAVDWLEVDPAHGTIFLLHGIRARRDRMRPWAEPFGAAGLRPVLVDLRGHGGSSGDYLSYGVFDARDLRQVLDALERRRVVAPPYFAFGVSYGAAVAIQWASADPRVEAVVAVAPFASLRDVARSYAPRVPRFLLDRAVDRAGALAGFDPDLASARDAVARTRGRLLLIHGSRDRRVPPWHSRAIFEARPSGTGLVLVDGATHRTIFDDPDGVVRRAALRFFLERP